MPRILVRSSPVDFLRAIAPVVEADSNATNHLVGFVFERWTGAGTTLGTTEGDVKPDADAEILVTVWEGDELRLMFSKLDWAQCKLVSPLPPSSFAALALPLIAPLVSHLLTLSPFSTSPALLRSLAGPQLLVDAFLAAWPHPRKPKPSMWMLPASTTVPPSPVSLPSGHSAARLKDVDELRQENLEHLARCLIGFFGDHDGAPKLTVEQAAADLRKTVPTGCMWVYWAPLSSSPEASASTDPVPVGFVTTGRPTLRTVAIRGVYVAPSHRGQGVAARLVGTVVRAHLVDAPRLPLDLEGEAPVEKGKAVEDERTKWGGKDEVCLFVEPDNPAARKVYGRIGFVEAENLWCDVDLEGIEPGHW
ncbi:hypothetical protein JCM10207_003107 [Rhodosporidiobolus poonsookiae]